MAVQCPRCRWPDMLEERGPTEDPSILLTGAAHIGEAEVCVVAIRIDATLRWSPDFRRAVPESSYRANGLDEILETTLEEVQSVASELAEFLGDSHSGVIELATGAYRVWVMPASIGS